ncbi:uncharacterized protein LOC109861760 isoform X2 [Pseudomyrmex gracilis]|uniref:uncharacterized protein LOC109861760 isoform X2 n=1 Tax=Pseudomyrmex gracilis TaxID=219809 RepID=UPI00099509EF|nr:uncharacterized protein LOC109861760 isoform X2 [Pseudomyrmex gracilis]
MSVTNRRISHGPQRCAAVQSVVDEKTPRHEDQQMRANNRPPENSMGNIYVCSLLVVLAMLLITAQCGDIMRKSIVFDKNTPDVFYCPQHKPIGFEKMLVKARPLSRLCQFEGRPIPEDYKSDCYNDVDETEYACKEKYRIMKRFSNQDGDAKATDNDYIEK